jgi:biopolymer transport protein ExbB/TolQ
MNMNLLTWPETFLYVVSAALFYPVVFTLVLLVFYVLFLLGGFLRDYLERRDGRSSVVLAYVEQLKQIMSQFQHDGRGKDVDIEVEKHIQHVELRLARSLNRVKLVIRIGPSLGLMGTLIPMGIALASLAQGEIANMAAHMVTAFAACVVGLGCATIAYVIAVAKEGWYKADLAEIAYRTEIGVRGGQYSAAKLDSQVVHALERSRS